MKARELAARLMENPDFDVVTPDAQWIDNVAPHVINNHTDRISTIYPGPSESWES